MEFRALIKLTRSQIEHFAKKPQWSCSPGSYPDRQGGQRFAVNEIDLLVEHPSGGYGAFKVHPVDISREGISFLHGGYIHEKSICTFLLPSIVGERDRVKGVVVRCCHLRGTLHEVGVAFEEVIDLSRYLASDDSNEQPRESAADEMNRVMGARG